MMTRTAILMACACCSVWALLAVAEEESVNEKPSGTYTVDEVKAKAVSLNGKIIKLRFGFWEIPCYFIKKQVKPVPVGR